MEHIIIKSKGFMSSGGKLITVFIQNCNYSVGFTTELGM